MKPYPSIPTLISFRGLVNAVFAVESSKGLNAASPIDDGQTLVEKPFVDSFYSLAQNSPAFMIYAPVAGTPDGLHGARQRKIRPIVQMAPTRGAPNMQAELNER
jgi:hypothetical protein